MNFEKLNRPKVFRDPLYGYIKVNYKIISDLIDTLELQRLRRIRQLSGVSMVFQTAEHSRFTHSLGAYAMACLVIEEVSGVKENMNEYEQIIFLASALLHDIGHGPYSHAFEHVLNISHEEMSAQMIISPITEVNKVLSKCQDLALDIASVIRHQGKYPLIESLISSQLDVDRMDYLSRDAYFTGATYGNIDRNRLLRSMIVENNRVYFRASGVHSIESYLMSRYHMYWQVYYHPTARAYELLLQNIYKRIKDLVLSGKKIEANIDSLLNVLKNNYDIKSYVELDDAYVNGMVKQLTKSDDFVLRELSLALEKRKLYSFMNLNIETDVEKIDTIMTKYKNNEILFSYFYEETKLSQAAYLHANANQEYDINDIKIMLPTHDVLSLEEYSPIINSLISSSVKNIIYIFYFEVSNV